ncbi:MULTISPECIES: winged helix-turn-helix domain-containing protein [unclassified Pseudoalteromonas]|uniref:winged helix-turn-helix domain-containing protein n=1 Tax=unclassified Pseudoalteromonas TaxID=194690 RepID=UPI00209843AD|nr:winged helix-turn-helix domain-containing protein [Pseudoalteromonas sp. XMcav2-N]MCO7189577.1 winged helix-turn-helix domain-containing protein [Pseudoalteromonas sp. XMcav2-N]
MEKLTNAFAINDIVIDPLRNQVQHPDGVNTLEPKAMALLCVLAAKSGTVVAQETLYEAVWPGRVFSPSSLQRLIALLRKALRDSSKSPKIIFTHAKQGYSLEARISQPKTRSEIPSRAIIYAITVSLLLSVIITYIYSKPAASISSTQPFTFTSEAEFGGQFSPDGEAIAFLRKGIDKQTNLIVRKLKKPTQDLYVTDNQIRDFIWLTNEQLIVALADSDGVKLTRYTLTQSGVQSQQSLPTIEHLSDISHLHKGPGSALYFVAHQLHNTSSSDQVGGLGTAIVQLNLVSFELTTLMPLSETQRVVDLAAAPDALYISLFEHKSNSTLAKIEPELKTVTPVHSELDGLYKLAWAERLQTLVLLDSLKPEIFTLSADNQLVPVEHDLSTGVANADIFQDKLLSTQVRQNIKVFSSRNPDTALIDSKYEDYLASVSPDGRRVVFVSNRSGYPQLYLTDHHTHPDVIFSNPLREDFISRAIWHPSNNRLVFAADNKVYEYTPATRELSELAVGQQISRVEYWQTSEQSKSEVLYLADAGQANIVSYEIHSGDVKLLPGSGHLVYADSAFQVYWHDNTLSTSAGHRWQPDSGKIRHAFSVDERILVQIAASDTPQLLEFNHQLTLLTQRPLPDSAQFVSSAFYTGQNALIYYYSHWKNTDSDLMLSKINP